MDETDKIFFLRKSINRSLKELAADKNNQDIQLLSEEFSKSMLNNSIFAIIQKREDTGGWIADFSKLDQIDYQTRLLEYRDCILREIAYKLYKSRKLEYCLRQLESAGRKIRMTILP